MTFKEAVLDWYEEIQSPHVKKSMTRFLERADSNPRLWHLAEQLVLTKYEKETGDIVGRPDWKKIITWFKANGPVFIKILMSVLSIIALL